MISFTSTLFQLVVNYQRHFKNEECEVRKYIRVWYRNRRKTDFKTLVFLTVSTKSPVSMAKCFTDELV